MTPERKIAFATSSLKKRSKQESEELNMGNTIAMILGNERSRTTPDFIRGSRVRRREEFEAADIMASSVILTP